MSTGVAGRALPAVKQALSSLDFEREEQPTLAPKPQAIRAAINPKDEDTGMSDSTPAGQKYLVPPSLPDAGCLLGTELPLPDLSPLISGLEAAVERGQQLLSSVYTYRCLTKVLPKASDDDTNRELQRKQLKVLAEAMPQLCDMLVFRDEAVRHIAEAVPKLTADRAMLPRSECVFDSLIHIICQLHALDTVKASRPDLSRDFELYCKTARILREGFVGNEDFAALAGTPEAELQGFFSGEWSCLNSLGDALEELPGSHALLAQLVHYIYYAMKEAVGDVVLPRTHFAMLGALPVLLMHLGSRAPLPDKGALPAGMETLGRLRLSKCLRLLRRHPVVPGVGDLVLQPGAVLSLSPFVAAAMQEGKDLRVMVVGQMDPRMSLELAQLHSPLASVEQVVSQHFHVCSRFAALQIEAEQMEPDSELPSQACANIAAVTRHALACLCRWSVWLNRSHSWKVAWAQRSTSHQQAEDADLQAQGDRPSGVETHYTREELAAAAEMIACIKGLAGALDDSLHWLQPLNNQAMHKESQDFVCCTIDHMIKPSSKSAVKDMLLQLKGALAYWPGGSAPLSKDAKGKGFMHAFGKKTLDVVRRSTAAALPAPESSKAETTVHACPPSRAQVAVTRQLVEQLLSAGEMAGKRSFINSADLSATSMKELADFLRAAKHWNFLMDIHETILKAADLSDMWLQEQANASQAFTPEARRARVQRGLTFHLLAAALACPGSGEAVLAPLHILNDACRRALEDFRVAHLYEEVRLETIAWTDLLVKAAGDQLFANVKARAAMQLCDSGLLAAVNPAAVFGDAANQRRLDELLEQRHLAVLARSIDLQELMAGRLQKLFQRNADYLISSFQSSNVTSVVELESRVAVLRKAHQILDEKIPLRPWSFFWEQVDLPGSDAQDEEAFKSKVAQHAAAELSTRVVAGYAMISGLHRMTQPDSGHKVAASAIPAAPPHPCFLLSKHGSGDSASHAKFASAHSGWFGEPHMEALLELIGKDGVVWLIGNLQKQAVHTMTVNLPPKICAAGDAMAAHVHASAFLSPGGSTQAASAVFSFYRSQLADALGPQAALTADLAQLGSCVFLATLADAALQMASRREFMQGAPFLGVAPAARSRMCRPARDTKDNPNACLVLEGLLAGSQASKIGSNTEQVAGHLMRQTCSQFWGSAIPHSYLQQWVLGLEVPANEIVKGLPRAGRGGRTAREAKSRVLGAGGQNPCAVEFFHVVSALLFLIADESTAVSIAEHGGRNSHRDVGDLVNFGDSVQWGAALLLCLLKQERRWKLADLASAVISSAELEIRFQHKRPIVTENSSNPSNSRTARQSMQPIDVFLHNARHVRTTLEDAVQVIRAAFPAAPPEPLPFPHHACMHSLSLQRQVWIQPEKKLQPPFQETEAIPETTSFELPDWQEDDAIPCPASPSCSLASVTTRNSPAGSLRGSCHRELLLPEPIYENAADEGDERELPANDGDEWSKSTGAVNDGCDVSNSHQGASEARVPNSSIEESQEVYVRNCDVPVDDTAQESISQTAHIQADFQRKRRMLPPPPRFLVQKTDEA